MSVMSELRFCWMRSKRVLSRRCEKATSARSSTKARKKGSSTSSRKRTKPMLRSDLMHSGGASRTSASAHVGYLHDGVPGSELHL